ncbi:B- and T-lymphocyte attenuator-like [Syngnathoides biaculeatus]|uniref:B- and T-lymphocyte attenuator-like n=1 Tax=Syngnathoides biaculeatus TaxID=300417 RepID=UPI002ADDDAFA|nr:B- and T-lymphocyte attenuator-like [Syngnathoides biaculeatus]
MKQSWHVLLASILAVQHLTSSSDGEDCLQIIRHEDVHNVSVGANLKMNCTYRYINCSTSSYVSWHKLENRMYVPVINDTRTEVKPVQVNNFETILLLNFTNIQMSNAGFYRCQSEFTFGQNIKVSVHDISVVSNISPTNETTMTVKRRWMYVYSAVGTLAFVIGIIFISVISMQRCKGNSQRETQSENQDFSVLKPTASARPHATQTSPGSFAYNRMASKEEKGSEARTETDGNVVVYAALHHQPPAGAPPRPRRPREESSEYADIRV